MRRHVRCRLSMSRPWKYSREKFHSPLRIGNDGNCRRGNVELYELYVGIDIVQRMGGQRLRWLNEVVRMNENTPALGVFNAVSAGGSRGRGNPTNRWRDQAESDLASLGNRYKKAMSGWFFYKRAGGTNANEEEKIKWRLNGICATEQQRIERVFFFVI